MVEIRYNWYQLQECWNWYTAWSQKPRSKDIRVQVPFLAPLKLKKQT